MQLRNALGATNIEVHLTMSPGDADFNKRDVLRFFKWFHAEKEAGRGELRRLAAKIIPEGLEKADLLNLIDAQMGDHSTLDLPTDNPEGSYNARIAFARRVLCNHRRAIKDQK